MEITWNELMDEHGMVHNTFWSDFSIAERFGEIGIKDTYDNAMLWKDNVEMFTAFVFALNYKAWHWNEKDEKLCELYVKLFEKARDFGYEHFKGEDLSYFWQKLD